MAADVGDYAIVLGRTGAQSGAGCRAGRSGCLRSAIDEGLDVPGIAAAIVKDGKVVMAKGYGQRKMGESAPVDENTLFESVEYQGVHYGSAGDVGGRGKNIVGRQSV
jgi:hypothetical protein